MSRIVTIKPAWIVSSEAGDHFEPQLFRLLRAIHDTGKLTQAVEVVQISYRHGWDLLAKWSGIFGSELVAMERGRGARLTTLGEKLLWAERRAEASLFPQLENIATELNVAIRKSHQRAATILRIQASHGYAVEKLPALVRRHGHAEIDLKYVGSVEALAALSRSACDLAGFHVPLGDLGPMLWEQYARWVKPQQQRIIRMVIRTQGLIVAKGNPLKIKSLRDLARKGLFLLASQERDLVDVLQVEGKEVFFRPGCPARPVDRLGSAHIHLSGPAVRRRRGLCSRDLRSPPWRRCPLDFVRVKSTHRIGRAL
jgi:molybdate transport repressor ModE-like protein